MSAHIDVRICYNGTVRNLVNMLEDNYIDQSKIRMVKGQELNFEAVIACDKLIRFMAEQGTDFRRMKETLENIHRGNILAVKILSNKIDLR